MQRDDWKTILKCPDYEINSAGEIRKKGTKILRKITVDKPIYGGYSKTTLRQGEKMVSIFVHKEVALAFLENPEGKEQVHHIDKNKQNNDVSNLMWVTRTEHDEFHKGEKKRSQLEERRKKGIL